MLAASTADLNFFLDVRELNKKILAPKKKVPYIKGLTTKNKYFCTTICLKNSRNNFKQDEKFTYF